MGNSDQRVQLLLDIQADLSVLKDVLLKMQAVGTTSRESAQEVQKLGAALQAAIAGHAQDVQKLGEELNNLRAANAATAIAVGQLSAQNSKLSSELTNLRTTSAATAKAVTQLGAENSKLSLGFEGSLNSIAALRAEQNRLSAELEKVRTNLGTAVNGLVKLSEAQNQAASSARASAAGQKEQAAAAAETASSFINLRTILASTAAYAAVQLAKSLVDADVAMQRVRMTMAVTSEGAGEVDDDLKFITNTANELGVNLNSVAPAFARFSVAARTAGLTSKQTRDIFKSFSGASSVLHLTAAETGSIFLALEQMFSKGKVQAQELTLQLGQSLPSANKLAAKALGVTTAEMSKMVEKGEILATDFVPKLAAVIQEQYAKVIPEAMKSTQSELSRLDNSLLEFKTAINQSGFSDMFAEQLRKLTDLIKELGDYAAKNPESIQSMGRALEAVAFGVFAAGAAASVVALGTWVAGLSAATVAAAALSLQIGAVGAAIMLTHNMIDKAVIAYGEMRDAQLENEGANGKVLAGLFAQIETMKSANELARIRSQILVQLAAAQSAYDAATKPRGGRGNQGQRTNTDSDEAKAAKEQLDRLHQMQSALDKRGLTVIDENKAEAEKLRILALQTEEITKQKAEIAKQLTLAANSTKESKTKYDKAYVDSLVTPEEKVNYLQGKLNNVNTAMATPLGTGGAQTPEEIKNAFIALDQRDKDLLVQKVELEKQIHDIRAKAIEEEDKGVEANRKDLEDQIKKGKEIYIQAEEQKRKNKLVEDEQALSRSLAVSDEYIARTEASRFITEEQKNAEIVIQLKLQNDEIQKRIDLLVKEQNIKSDPTRQDQIDKLRKKQGDNNVKIEKDTPMTAGQGINAGIVNEIDKIGSTGQIVARGVGTAFQGVFDGLKGSIQGLIEGTMTWGDALRNIGTSILSGVISAIAEMFAQWIVKRLAIFALDEGLKTAGTASTIAQETATLPVKTAGAVASGISSYGFAIAGGLAALALIASLSFSDGGYTGPGGKYETAGVVHKGEVVFSQADVSRLGGVQAVENLRVGRGGFPTSAIALSGPVIAKTAGESPSIGGSTVNLHMHANMQEAALAAQKSPKGEAHIVDVFRRNIHSVTGRG